MLHVWRAHRLEGAVPQSRWLAANLTKFHAARRVEDARLRQRDEATRAANTHLTDDVTYAALLRWVDVAGSKVRSTDILRMAWGLCRIRSIYFYHEWPSGARRGVPKADLCFLGSLLALALGGLGALLLLGLWVAARV